MKLWPQPLAGAVGKFSRKHIMAYTEDLGQHFNLR